MASVKYGKDSVEFAMFQEFWKLFQEYAIPEDNDFYWKSMQADCERFYEKYQNHTALQLARIIRNNAEERSN